MKTLLIAVTAALVSAAASVGSAGTLAGLSSDKELAVELPISAAGAKDLVPFLERAAREQGLTRIRAYDRDIFIPLEQATLSFVRDGDAFTLHVAVESEYRFGKADRPAALAALKERGQRIFLRALQLQGAATP